MYLPIVGEEVKKEKATRVDSISLVVKSTTIHIVLTVALSKPLPIHQLDVHNVFLHGEFHEIVCISHWVFCDPRHPNYVCRLRKSLYGLNQTPCDWYKSFADIIVPIGF